MKRTVLIVYWALLVVLTHAQTAQPGNARPDRTLYLHMDKTVYTNNETIWFSAYLLNAPDLEQHRVLSVFLAGNDDRKVSVAEKFRMENGLSSGSLVLPDSIPSGNYQLMAYTDQLDEEDRPVAVFSAPIAVRRGGQPQSSKVPPSTEKKRIDVRFFPEGGHLLEGIPCLVAWEARTDQHAPVTASGILLKNGRPIDTIETNSYGVGSFTLQPESNDVYTLKIEDTVFTLPRALQDGIALHLPQAVADDSLQVNIFSREQRELQVLVHQPQGAYALFKLQAPASQETIRLPLHMLPKGMAAITIIDMQGKPLAERLFFAHYHEQVSVNIKTGKTVYRTKDSVIVHLKMTDQAGKPQQGVFSFAAVQDSRLSTDFQDIEYYAYLVQHLGRLPKDPLGEGFRNREYLEDMLLTKGWRKYTWQDTARSLHTPVITASITRKGKPLKSPVNLIAIGSSALGLISTANDGTFTLENEKLFMENDRKIALMVAGPNASAYTVRVHDPFIKINQALADSMEKPAPMAVSMGTLGQGKEFGSLGNTVHLQAVTIKGKQQGMVSGMKEEPGVNACGDYVDEYEYLNYPYSEHKFKPIVGKLYRKRIDLDEGMRRVFKVDPVYYSGCQTDGNPAALLISGIYGARTFYGVAEDATRLQYLSTICWRSGILTNEKGEAEIRFKAGDLAGRFRIVLQGVTNEGLVSGNSSFDIAEDQ